MEKKIFKFSCNVEAHCTVEVEAGSQASAERIMKEGNLSHHQIKDVCTNDLGEVREFQVVE